MTVSNVLIDLAGSQLFARLLEATVKSSMLLLAALAAERLLRRRSAALRHLIWMTGVATALAVLFLAPVMPSWRIWPTQLSWPAQASVASATQEGLPAAEISRPRSQPESRGAATSVRESNRKHARVENRSVVPATTSTVRAAAIEAPRMNPGESWKIGPLAVWILGVVACSAYYLVGILQLRRLLSRAESVSDPEWNRSVKEAASRLSIKRPVALVWSDGSEVPLTCGVLHPSVILPADFREWNQQRMHAVIHHELAHIARMDTLSQAICHIACALYWFNPLMWFAVRAIRFERERACDDYVLAAGAAPSSYANDLLIMVSSITKPDNCRVALAMARPSHFEGRLVALLNPKVDRNKLSKRTVLLIGGMTAALMLPLAALSPAARAAAPAPKMQSSIASDPASAAIAPTASAAATQTRIAAAKPTLIASTREIAEPPAPVASAGKKSTITAIPPADRQTGFECGNNVESRSEISSHSDDGHLQTWKVLWDAGNCKVALNSRGEVSFNSDFTDIQRIGPGGFVDIDTSVNGETRHLGIRPSGSGALEYAWSVNGSSRSFDQDGHAWLAKLLIALDRDSAMGVKQRLPKLLQEGGPRRVLDEVSYMNSDYARAIYLIQLMGTADLSPADLQLVLTRATEMASDYECARVLMVVANKYPLNQPAMRSGFLTAIDNLHSDYEHARVLMVFFSKGEIPIEMARSILQSASRLQSDYEHARVLVEMATRRLVDSRTQADFLKSVNDIKSDYEHARTLVAFFEARKSDDEAVLGVIRSVPEIHSDYEQSRVLTTVASGRRIEGDLREEYLSAARSIHSDYDRSKAVNALGIRPASL